MRGRWRVVIAFLLLARAASTSADTIYISDEQADAVHVVVAPHWNEIASIPVGRRPRGLSLSPDGRELFVATSNDDRIEVVDLATRRVVRTIASGPDPERFAISPDGLYLYVANEDDE
jgi:YVTN family beta-propeller protein